MEVRTGKTFTALMTAHKFGAKSVLFLTVKKAIKDIQKDIDIFGKLDVEILSVDSAHKATGVYDLVIIDEAHGLGSFPKPNKRARAIKTLLGGLPMILMSGTPNPESYSQLYHQFWVSYWSPFKEYTNFYQWCKDYVNVIQKMRQGRPYNEYQRAHKDKVSLAVNPYFHRYSQRQANFICEVREHILTVELHPELKDAIQDLKRHKVIEGADFDILGDTPVKMMSKIHQMSSGHVISEQGDYIQLDTFKADFIEQHFAGKKIAIFYKYKTELEMLKELYGDQLTEDITEFNETDKNIAYQIRSGSMGVNLSAAECQVFYNIDFSSKDYIQSKARLQTQDRLSCDVYFVFSDGGLEQDIYKSLQAKKDFTSVYFKQYF